MKEQYGRAYAVCRRILGSEDDALDAAQEAMIAAARNIARFDRRSRFSTWVYRVATNAALDELRRRQRRPVVASDEQLEASLPGPPGVPPGPGDPVGERTVARLSIEEALGLLSEDQRAAVVLRDVEGLDYGEIAEVLEIPIGTVRSRIARGRAAFAVAYGGERGIAAGRAPGEGNDPGATTVESSGSTT